MLQSKSNYNKNDRRTNDILLGIIGGILYRNSDLLQMDPSWFKVDAEGTGATRLTIKGWGILSTYDGEYICWHVMLAHRIESLWMGRDHEQKRVLQL